MTPESVAGGDFLGLWDLEGHKDQSPKKAPESLRILVFKLNMKLTQIFQKGMKKNSMPLQKEDTQRKLVLPGFVSGIPYC